MSADSTSAAVPVRHGLTPLLILTALGLALRLVGLGHESIWYDEAISMNLARADALDLVTGLEKDEGNPAGYFLLLHGWLTLLGSSSIETARAMSALAGALGVPAVWLLARSTGQARATGLLAAFLVAVSPQLVYLGREARVFALFATVATLAAATAARAERGGGLWSWAGFAAAGAVLVHLHYYGAFVLAALGLHLLAWGWRNDRRAILKLAGCAVVVIVAFLPWLPSFRAQLALGASRCEKWWQHLVLLPLYSTAGRTFIWKESGNLLVALADLQITALVFAPLAVALWRTRPRPGLLITFVAGVPLLAAIVSVTLAPMIHSNYLAGIFPALLLLIACGLEASVRLGPRMLAFVPTIVLALVMPAALIRLYTVPHKTDWRGVAELVGQHGGELPVFFYEDIGADPFAYYRPEQPQHRIITRFDGGHGWEKHYKQMFRAKAGFWVVLYMTSAPTRAEESAIDVWLEKTFIVEEKADFQLMQVRRCRPRIP